MEKRGDLKRQLREIFATRRGILDEPTCETAKAITNRLTALDHPSASELPQGPDARQCSSVHGVLCSCVSVPTQELEGDVSTEGCSVCSATPTQQRDVEHCTPMDITCIQDQLELVFASVKGTLTEDQLCQVSSLQRRLLQLTGQNTPSHTPQSTEQVRTFAQITSPSCFPPTLSCAMTEEPTDCAKKFAYPATGCDLDSPQDPQIRHDSWLTASKLPTSSLRHRRTSASRQPDAITECALLLKEELSDAFSGLGLSQWSIKSTMSGHTKNSSAVQITPVADFPY
jgi:hypothetical protein